MNGSTSLAERLVERSSSWLAGRGLTRRRFLSRVAIVGAALSVDPVGFVLKPRTAYASVCGSGASCSSGWTAFCCTVNNGANTCPEGSFPAGWWKIDSSPFCRGAARYIVDCNRRPGVNSCSCRCANGACDKRRTCCNVFRYGQCHTEIRGTTEVVCRLVLCTPPWEWDSGCSRTVRTDNRTRSHNSSCNIQANPSYIEMRYSDLGLRGSALGVQNADERDAPGGGRIAGYANGLMTWHSAYGARYITGSSADRFGAVGGIDTMGYLRSDPQSIAGGGQHDAENGTIWWSPETGAFETTGPIDRRYRDEYGPPAWLGFPVTGVQSAPGGRQRSHFASGWSIVADPATGETRIYPSDVEMPADGSWPAQTAVQRIAGASRFATAVAVSRELFEPGVPIAVVARGDEFADAVTGGVAAGVLGGPVLLTPSHQLDPDTRQELERLRPQRIAVLGGTTAVQDRVVQDLGSLTSGDVVRWAGQDRSGTAVAVSQAFADPDDTSTVFVASGWSFAEPLAVSPAAVRARSPILLVTRDALPEVTARELERLEPDRIVILGGDALVSGAVEQRLADHAADVERWGSNDRYTTSAAVAERTAANADEVVVATGNGFADGLAAGPLAAARGAPILLVTGDRIPPTVDQRLRRQGATRATVVGGPSAVPVAVAERLGYYPVA